MNVGVGTSLITSMGACILTGVETVVGTSVCTAMGTVVGKCGCKCGREGKSVYLSARSDVVHQLRQGSSDGSIMLFKCLAYTLQGVYLRL